jgi:putative ABC transport system permease protein
VTASPRWSKVLRDVRLHKARTLLVVLAVAIGLVGAAAVLDTWALVRVATRSEYLASNPASATLRTDSIDAALLARVRAVPGVRDAEARRTVTGRLRARGGWQPAVLFAADDFPGMRIGALRPDSGAWPPPAGAIAVERSSLPLAEAAPGDSVAVAIGTGEPVTLPVSGTVRDVGLAPGWMEHVVYGFVTRATLARLGAPTSLDELRIVVRDPAADREAVRAVAWRVRAVVEGTGRRVTNVDVPVPGRHIHAAQMDSLLYTQGAFGALALLLSGFLVLNLVAAMLAGQVREIGVMKVLGARGGQLAAMYLSLALGLGLVAAALALPAAAFIGRRYAAFQADLLNFDTAGYAIPLPVIALELLAAMALPVAAAALPVLRGCRISPGEALRDLGIAGSRTSAGRVLAGVSGVTRPLLLSLRNAFRRRQRMTLTLLALATGGAVYLGALNLRQAVRRAVAALFAPQRFDLTLRLDQPHPADSIEAGVARIPGVAGVEAWSAGRAAVSHADGTLGNTFVVTGPPPGSRLLAQPMTSGRWLRPDDRNALVVNEGLLADEPGLRVGGPVTLVIDGRATEWTVVGAVATIPSPSAYAPRDALARLAAGGLVDLVMVDAAIDGASAQLDLIQRLRTGLERDGLAVRSTQLVAETRRVLEDHLLMVAEFLGVMAWVMIVVGGLGLASTMGLATLERTREIGVLRAIGARHRTILAVVQAEGLVIALLSWAVAVPLSVPISVVLGRAFGRVMLPVPVMWVPDGAAMLWWLGLVVTVSVIACAWPAVRAMRVPAAAALAYE